MTGNWAQGIQLASLVAASHLAGYGLCSDRVALHNAIALSDRDTIVREWYRGWEFGRKYGPVVVSGSALGFLVTALLDGVENPSFFFNIAASVSMGLIVPYTVFSAFPVNDQLLAEHAKLTNSKKPEAETTNRSMQDVRNIAAMWKTVDWNRTLLATFAALAGLIAASK